MRALPLVALALLVPFALAGHGGTPQGRCGGGTGMIELTDGTPQGTWYLDERGPANGVWLYEESNGVWFSKMPGIVMGNGVVGHDLQRGDASIFGVADRCVDVGHFDPDTLHV